ncbi:MAG: PaaI family thioesterase [Arenicellaceae bacterium]|nr:PaaI family thioesterase [Arenicellaceae bacterium]
MNEPTHFKALENMYAAAPINEIYKPSMAVSEGAVEIEIELSEKFHHSAGAIHGSVYFKMLDDAAFFAANSYEQEFFVLTTSFTTYLTKPVSEGKLKAAGKVVNKNKTQFIAESIVYDSGGIEIGRGNGVFVRSKMPLSQAKGYAHK